MDREIDINRKIHDLCQEYPELASLLYELGFTEIVKPMMLATLGKIMTLKQGASLRKVDLEIIKSHLRQNGFQIKEESHE